MPRALPRALQGSPENSAVPGFRRPGASAVPYDGCVESSVGPGVGVLALGGIVAGLWLLARGFSGYRSAIRVGDTSTSTISSVAAGEVRISGIVEPAELTLISLLQSVPCVFYRASIGNYGDDGTADSGYTEEHAVGFQVRDATGILRVFPRGARIDAPERFEGETGMLGDEPPGLSIRLGGATQASDIDRAAAEAALLTVQDPDRWTLRSGLRDRRGRRRYRERRLELGDPVTIVGRAVPFADLNDPAGADIGSGADMTDMDPEVAADLAEARAAGTMADDPAEAWGNAAIPGFGIGRPVTAPEIDPAATPLPLASPEEAARTERTFAIAPETLVLAASSEVPLLIAHGVPGAVVQRGQTSYLVGLMGVILAIASAMVLAVYVTGEFRL